MVLIVESRLIADFIYYLLFQQRESISDVQTVLLSLFLDKNELKPTTVISCEFPTRGDVYFVRKTITPGVTQR